MTENTDKILELVERLKEKYNADNQPVEGYLEGFAYQNYLDYWDYIHVDALLSLQAMRTNVPDEMIFIVYHQITELYFKLILWEVKQITDAEGITVEVFTERLRRMSAYFSNLTRSFEIMIDGMYPDQFLKFRLSLLPASGFQSAQYRKIEMASTSLINLVEHSHREEVAAGTIEDQYQYIYWKKGATDLATGAKTLTLRRFEDKYKEEFLRWANTHKTKNILSQYLSLNDEERANPELINAMRTYDEFVNVHWPAVHMKSAGKYLGNTDKNAVAATGGTNWRKYLPPRFQRRIFYPTLWSKEEVEEWGK
ncbi:MAG: tryptophan 2,3-dioxygenase family protein [Bacteroidetes bacterium]|nr:tryptophan 2,3-dioxygenase family protein [Bacteroidota bacterium]